MSSVPVASSAPMVNMAFTGEYRGATWNARSLFARKARRQAAKRAYVEKLLGTHDFIGVQETHSTEGFVKAMRSFTNTTARHVYT